MIYVVFAGDDYYASPHAGDAKASKMSKEDAVEMAISFLTAENEKDWACVMEVDTDVPGKPNVCWKGRSSDEDPGYRVIS